MEEIYRLEKVNYNYGETEAVRDLSFTIRKGECVSIIGSNGSGKSTLLKMLDCLIFPTSGTVFFLGKAIEEWSKASSFRSQVGFVFHEADAQLFSPTVFDEISFGPLQLGLKEEDILKRVEDTIKMLQITALRDRAPYTLSSGEKRKVAIASVLAINPEVLLLDEPTTGLDPRTQVWLMELLIALKGLKKTIIIATHDLSLAEDLTERVIALDESHGVSADGRTKDVLTDKTLLLRINLIHEHAHRHGDAIHTHGHSPFSVHDEHE